MENHQKIQWGIIGCGDVTEKKSGPAFNKVPDSGLAAVMRRNAEKARDYAQRHGVPRWYHDAEELVNDPGVNAIYVATPPDSHLMYARMALEAGKPVYVEKPVTLNSAEASALVDLARQYDDKVVVAHYRRKWPLFQQVKAWLDAGAIGRPVAAQLHYARKPLTMEEMQRPGVQWRINPAVSGGGLFHDLAPHQLDLLLYWLGDAVEAFGTSSNRMGQYDAPDTVKGSIRFQSSLSFEGFWSFCAPEDEQRDSCVITGERGRISCSIFWGNELVLENERGKKVLAFDLPQHNQIYLIDEVVQFFLGRGPNPCSAADGLRVMQLMDAFSGC